MQAVKNDYMEIEVTPEEEEAWINFLVKFANTETRLINYETTIPRENLNGVFGSSN